ncbi:MAG: phosphoribosyltransferase family protein [Gracilibacteraceae bacterium]|jgi:adenine/guanine phosphoribosyltransferase-like PRPP-binding protein|nr:phosphoribosyltransferase family protein [Gracilibacteraceae bacterium]
MSEQIIHAGPDLHLALSIRRVSFCLRWEQLFGLAARRNPRRAFLFVSRVLGKHLVMPPHRLLAAAKLLALEYTGQSGADDCLRLLDDAASFEECAARLAATRAPVTAAERTLFIGFAETATGLAQALANSFRGEIAYVHTTRLVLPGERALEFTENHSHASEHYLYLEPGVDFLASCQQAAFIDDELTTGRTVLAGIRALHAAYGLRRFLIFSLLDWRDPAALRAQSDLAAELGLEIHAFSLLQGDFREIGGRAEPATAPTATGIMADYRGLPGTGYATLDLSALSLPGGRHPLRAEALAAQPELCFQAAAALKDSLPLGGGPALYIGTGELIYAPLLCAGYLGGGDFHSTTQSPIVPLAGSAIENGVCFDPPDTYSRVGYLYNVPRGRYSQAVIFAEKKLTRERGLGQLARYFRDRGIGRVTAVLL